MPTAPQLRLNFLYACLIVLIGFFIYANSLQDPFIYDDGDFIVRNSSIHNFSDFKAIVDFSPTRWVGTWTFALNYALGGLDVRGYHVFNILAHLGCGLLVWWFLCLILSAPKFSSLAIAAQKENLSFWAALLFITHPVQTMAVDHITQRYVSLAALFYLTSLCLYLKGRLSKGRGIWGFFLASGLAGFMGIFTRETVVTLPLALVLCEVFILDGFRKVSTDGRKYWLLAGAVFFIAGIVLFFYRMNIVDLLTRTGLDSQSHSGETVTAFSYFLTQFRVILIYVRILFWPVLNFDYDMSLSHSFWEPDVLSGCLFVVLLFTYAVRVRSKYPLLSFGVFWFFLTLSVESTIFPIPYVITEYRLYLPLFGFCIGFVSVMSTLIQDRRAYTILMGIMILICSILTIQRNLVYKDQVSLWTDTIKKSPLKPRPYINLGEAYTSLGEYPKALKYLNRALELEPANYHALIGLVQVYTEMGVFDKAIEIDERLLRMHPSVVVYNNLGLIYYIRGDLNKAQEYFYIALQAKDFYPETYFNLARVYLLKGQTQKAKEIYLKILFQEPRENMARYALIRLYLGSDQFPPFELMVKDVLASKNNDPQELVSLGSMVASKGYLDMAIDFYTKAVSIDYTYPEAYIEMGKLFYNQGRKNDAIHIWQIGIKYAPNDSHFKDLISQAQK